MFEFIRNLTGRGWTVTIGAIGVTATKTVKGVDVKINEQWHDYPSMETSLELLCNASKQHEEQS